MNLLTREQQDVQNKLVFLGKHTETILYRHSSIKVEVNHVDQLFLNVHQRIGSKDLWKKRVIEGRKRPNCNNAKNAGQNGQMKSKDRLKIVYADFQIA